jgi:hypothetical protein
VHAPAPGTVPDLSPPPVPYFPIIKDLTIYTVFWLPANRHYEPAPLNNQANDLTYEQLMQQWTLDVGDTAYYNLLTQYYDANDHVHNNVAFGGSYVDATAYPHQGSQADPVTATDIVQEVDQALANNPGWGRGQDHLVAVFTANDVYIRSDATNLPCGFHGPMSDPSGALTYAAIGNRTSDCGSNSASGPHSSSTDGAVSTFSHEVFEDVTDPIPPETWTDTGHQEIGDKCRGVNPEEAPGNTAGADVYLHGHAYRLQQEWSNAAHTCAIDYCPTTVVCEPSIVITESAADPTPVEGSYDDFTVDVTNNSDTAAATGVMISGYVPYGYLIENVLGNPVTPPAATFSLYLSYLPVHGTQTIPLHVHVGQAGYAGTSCAQATFSDLLGAHAATVQATQCAQTTPTTSTETVAEATEYNNMFSNYGDIRTAAQNGSAPPGQWTGGDGAQSTLLPNGDTAWFFNDSFYGQVGTNGTRALFTNSQPRNMIAIQQSWSLTQSIVGPPPPNNYLDPYGYGETLVAGPAQYSDQSHYNLTGGDGIMVGNTLYKFYTVMDSTMGTSAFPDWPVDTALATFAYHPGANPELTLSSTVVVPIPNTPQISWGIALLNDGGYTYIYGVQDQADPIHKYLYIARVPQGQITNWNAWEFRASSGWTSSVASATPVRDYVSDGFSVTNVNGTYVLLTTNTTPGNNPWQAVAYYASTPDGFDTASVHPIYTPPLRNGLIAYEYRIHPQFSSGGTVLIGYSTNTLNMDLACMSESFYDASIYRPRFLAVRLPGIGGTAGSITPNPTGPTWGTGPEYPNPKPVAPENEVWNDPTHGSWTQTECPYYNPPPAPTPVLTASPNADASITLHWTESPTAMWVYNLLYHDDTADPNWNSPPASDPNCAHAADHGGWCITPYPMVAVNDLTMQYLQPQHTYRFEIQAGKWRSGGTALSTPVSAVAYLAKPTTRPVNVHTVDGYGAVTITWDDPTPNVWFKVFLREINGTAWQETQYPTPNHTFTWYGVDPGTWDFTVVENNQTGDGPESDPRVHGTSMPCGSNPNPPCDTP